MIKVKCTYKTETFTAGGNKGHGTGVCVDTGAALASASPAAVVFYFLFSRLLLYLRKGGVDIQY